MKNQLTSNRLNVNAGIMSWYVKELKKLTKRMTKECLERLTEVYKQGYTQISLDESISSQARIALNELNRKYSDKFSTEAKELFKAEFEKQAGIKLQNDKATDKLAAINNTNSAPASSQGKDIDSMSEAELRMLSVNLFNLLIETFIFCRKIMPVIESFYVRGGINRQTFNPP